MHLSTYMIIHGQLREIPDDELMHWKYIKREKVNGKWKYYYDLGEKEKKNYEQAKKAYDTRKAQVQSAYRKKLPVAGGLKSDGNVAAARYYNSDSRHKSASYDKLKKNLDEAEAAYEKTPMAKREARSEKVKRSTEKVKNWAKDKLGYDEKQAMETAKTNAKVKNREYSDTAKKNEQWKAKHPGNEGVKEMADWQTNYYQEKAIQAWSEAQKSVKAYEKTPLAKIEKMQDIINFAKKWVSGDHGESERAELAKANFELRNARAKEKHHREQYEDVKRKVDSGEYFDKDRGNEALLNDWKKDVDQAHKETEAAFERAKKAQAVYDDTPLGIREKRAKKRNKR